MKNLRGQVYSTLEYTFFITNIVTFTTLNVGPNYSYTARRNAF